MDFAITFKADFAPSRIVALTRQAEAAGFNYGWSFDSHVLWQEVYPLLTLMAVNTKRMRLGTCVTNPRVRSVDVTASALATLNKISGNRMVLGMGRGDSSRRVMGKKPTTVEYLKTAALQVRDLARGQEVVLDGQPVRIPWADGDLPVWLAGYGPKVCRAIGEVADGIVLQFADPHLIKWCLGFVKEGAAAAGRDFSKIQVMAAAPVWISDDLDKARAQVRWFPAMVGNHIADMVTKHKESELPTELTAYIKGRKGYDYRHHADKDADHLDFITNDVIDRFAIIGPVEAHRRKLKELAQVGVTQFNIYLMCGEEERQVEVYGQEIIPFINGT
jgi:probable F420-dependent oxidoreductase